MSEAKFWEKIRNGLSPYGHLQRIETGEIMPGVPDVNYCFKGGDEGWFEMKYASKIPAFAETSVFASCHNITADQESWLIRRRSLGGRAYILFGVDDWTMLLDGIYAPVFNRGTFTQLRTHSELAFHKRVEWERLYRTLVNVALPTSPRQAWK